MMKCYIACLSVFLLLLGSVKAQPTPHVAGKINNYIDNTSDEDRIYNISLWDLMQIDIAFTDTYQLEPTYDTVLKDLMNLKISKKVRAVKAMSLPYDLSLEDLLYIEVGKDGELVPAYDFPIASLRKIEISCRLVYVPALIPSWEMPIEGIQSLAIQKMRF